MALGVNALRAQIEQAKKNLQSVDENITKITGRDPNEPRVNPNDRGFRSNDRGRLGTVRLGRRGRNVEIEEVENDAPAAKRTGGVFRRIGSHPSDAGRRVVMGGRRTSQRERSPESDEDTEDTVKKTVQSSVVSTAKEVTKKDIINAQNVDEKGKARNRRMFGMLLGTLARFQTDESKADQAVKQEKRRTEIEKRLEETMSEDRRQAAAERRELYTARKAQQRKINLLEQKVALASELESWEKEWELKSKFIMTKATPPIFFLPKDTTGRTIRALKESSKRMEEKAEAARTSMTQTLSQIDEEIRMLEDNGKKQEKEEVRGGRGVEVETTEGADELADDPNVDINVDMDGVNDGVQSGGDGVKVEGKSDLSLSTGDSDSDMFRPNSQESVFEVAVKMEPESGSLNLVESIAADEEEEAVKIENVDASSVKVENIDAPSVKMEAVEEDSENKSSSPVAENGGDDVGNEKVTEEAPPSGEDEKMATSSGSESGSESEAEEKPENQNDENSSEVENNGTEKKMEDEKPTEDGVEDVSSEAKADSKTEEEDHKSESGSDSSSEGSNKEEDAPQKALIKPAENQRDEKSLEVKKPPKEQRKPIRKRQPSSSSSSSSSSSEEDQPPEKNRRRRRPSKSPPRNSSRRSRKSESSPVRSSHDNRHGNKSSRRRRRSSSSSSSSRSRSPVKSSRRRRDSHGDRKRRDSRDRRRRSRSNSRSRYSRSSGRRR